MTQVPERKKFQRSIIEVKDLEFLWTPHLYGIGWINIRTTIIELQLALVAKVGPQRFALLHKLIVQHLSHSTNNTEEAGQVDGPQKDEPDGDEHHSDRR